MSLPMSKTAPYAIVGCILSMYALYVEHKVAHKSPDEEFSALCDIEQLNASCRWGACGFDLLWLGLASLSSCLWLCTKTKRRIRVRGGTETPNKTSVLSIDLISLSISHLIFHFYYSFAPLCIFTCVSTATYSNCPRVGCWPILELFRRTVSWIFPMQH